MNVAKYIPIHGCSYIETPKSIACKGAVVNVKNNDNMCFIWAILYALRNSDVKSNFNRVTNYEEYIHTLKFDTASMPMKIEDISRFEKLNGLAINVYSIREHGSKVNPLRHTKIRDTKLINFLLIIGLKRSHFVWIKNFNRLLCDNKTTRKSVKVYCPHCMYGFVKHHNGVQKLMYHKQQCSTLTPQRVELPVKGKEILHFTDVEKRMKLPFVIYADFECLNTTIKGVKTQNSIRKKSIHKVSAFCYIIISPYYQTKTVTYRGKFAGIKFLKNLVHEAEKIQEILKIGNKEMEQLSLK